MTDNTKTSMSSSDEDQSPSKLPAAFSGYRPFPPVMNLYSNFSGILEALTTFKLCGADKSDLLYIVEMHHGFTPRGPLHFRPGLYLRNGTTTKSPILAAAGDESRQPLLVSTVNLKSAIMLPPLDTDLNPRDLVTEIMHATTSTSDHSVSFRFSIEVGIKTSQREEFEWRTPTGTTKKDIDNNRNNNDNNNSNNNGNHKTRFLLFRLPLSASSSSSSPMEGDGEPLAELVLSNVMSWNHMFSLELKNAGRSGEMGDRWTLMAVATALRIYWLRAYGKTNKAIVRTGEKIRGKY